MPDMRTPRSPVSVSRRPAVMAVGVVTLALVPFLRPDARGASQALASTSVDTPVVVAREGAADQRDEARKDEAPTGMGIDGRVAPADPISTASTASPAVPRAVRDASLRPMESGDMDATWGPESAPFEVEVDGEPVPYRVMAVVVLPGAEARVRLPKGAAGAAFRHEAGTVRTQGDEGWVWTAPAEPGIHPARVEAGGAAVDLTFLVAHPAEHVEGGELHGYRIGAYVQKPLRGLDAYRPPDRFVEVRREDRDVLVSPHFTLGQFLCKQPGEPRFVSLSLPLLRKLEAVLEATNAAGIETPSFHVMSGFRTPAYNRAIGNTTDYSRHLWGDAADIFVDVDGDGDMDDLNGDGRSTIADARVLAEIVEGVEREQVDGVEPGGLGSYRRNAAHGPFVHVDARGYRARW